MNYSDLQSRLLAILGRAPAAVVYEMVTADVNQRLRLQCMESKTTLAAVEEIALPADFLAVSSVYLDQSPRIALAPASSQGIHGAYQSSGTARNYAIEDGTMRVNPVPNQNIVLRYYAKLADLSGASDENDVLTKYPQIYIYGALYHHMRLIRNREAAADYVQDYQEAMKRAEASDARDAMSGGPMQILAGHTP